MSYNGSGTFQINTSGQPVVTGTSISSTVFNALTADLATGLSTAITKDGQTTTTARIPFALGINSTLVTDATNTTSGSIITAGGVGIAKAVFIGTTLNVAGASTMTGSIAVDSVTDSSSTTTGSIQTDGGVGIAKALFVGTTANIAGVTTVQAGTAALPAITTTGDTNTGIFFSAADTLNFSTGGADKGRFSSNANGVFTVGTQSSVGGLGTDYGTIGAWGSSGGGLRIYRGTGGGSPIGTIYADAGGLFLSTSEAQPMTFSTNSTERMRINPAGQVLIGCTTNPTSSISGKEISTYFQSSCGTTTTSFTHFFFTNGNGNVGTIQTNGSATTYNTSSDYRLKGNIAPMTGALAKVAQLKPVTYKWKVDGADGEGFIAHELAEVVPQCVSGEKDAVETQQYEISPTVPATFDEDGTILTPAVEAVMGEREVPKYQGVDTSFLVATLTAAIQEQQALITTLTARITALEGA